MIKGLDHKSYEELKLIFDHTRYIEAMRHLEQVFGTAYIKLTGDEFKSVMEDLAQHATPKIDKRPYFRRFEKRKF